MGRMSGVPPTGWSPNPTVAQGGPALRLLLRRGGSHAVTPVGWPRASIFPVLSSEGGE